MLKGKCGFSLVELLIALLLGSLLLTMIISLYLFSVSAGAKSLKQSRLRTDLQSLIAVMENDIRRAGYGGRDYLVGSGAVKTVDTIHGVSENCIIYYYNQDHSESLIHSNKMAFRFDADNQRIQFGRGVAPLAADCYNSGNGHWEAMTDNKFIKITKLVFTESEVSSASATLRSVFIELSGELSADSQYKHFIKTKVQVRNLEYK
ncbi:prepilin-type N-terminal cleavage/methylation domain-containing protein [Psychromonas sp. MME2]|uniref:prepilin-type N-terminal cleavage/methylation domain-containing protein n=1 Tax=unclassified Psychromonas TaxID=2614957 RepID=UPI00339C250C